MLISEDQLKRQIKSGSFAPAYLIFGDDAYLKKNYVNKICSAVSEEDDVFNLQRYFGDCNLQDVYDAVSQFPMMADKKCVTLCDYDFERADKSDFEKLYELLSNTSDTCVLVVWFDSVEFDSKKSAKAKKLLSALQKGGGHAVCLNHKGTADLVKMLIGGAQKRGCSIDAGAARLLIETAGNDINTLNNELNKLCSFVGKGNIDKNTVEKVVVKTVEASVYNLNKAIFNCNVDGALKMLDELFFMRIEAMIILHTVSSAYIDIYRVAAAKKAGQPVSAVAEVFGYKGREFVLERAAENLKKLDSKRLFLSFGALLEADRSLKSFGWDERIILEQLVVRLIYIIVKGEAVDPA